MIVKRPPRLLDARDIVRDVRPEDRREWLSAAEEMGLEPDLTFLLAGCIQQAAVGSTLEVSGRPVCIWGASSVATGRGIAWLIATNEGQAQAARLQRYFKAGIAEMHEVFPRLEAHAFEENTLHHLWMKRLGFAQTGLSPAFASGRFLLFERDTAQSVPRPH